MSTRIEAVWDKDKEISMLRKALHNADTEICKLRNKHKEEDRGKSFVKVPVSEVIACKSKIDSLKDMLRTSVVFNVILGIATLVFACFTNF